MTDRPIIFSASMVRALLDGRKTQTRRLITPGTCTVLGSRVTAKSQAWAGLKFDKAAARITGPLGTLRPHLAVPWVHPDDEARGMPTSAIYRIDPIVEVGDRLWVRESFVRYHELDDDQRPSSELMICYRADGWPCDGWYDPDREETRDSPPWKSSIHMPLGLSRLTLAVTEVRVERLKDISEADAAAEGVERIDDPRGVCWRSYETLPDGSPHPHAAAPNSSPVTSFREIWTGIHGLEAWDANPWVVAISFTVRRQNIDALSEVAA